MGMNLLGILKREVEQRGITDKVQIKDHLYERVGQIFEYDPRWIFASDELREELRNHRVNITEVTPNDLYATCFSWSYMFQDLLLQFAIPARVTITKNGENEHACVLAYINGQTYLCDLMSKYDDLVNVKFGLDTCNNRVLNEEGKEFHSEALERMKSHLQDLNQEEYVYKIFKIAEVIMNIPRPNMNIGYISGIRFISKLLKFCVAENFRPNNLHFLDDETGNYFEGYEVNVGKRNFFFIYKSNVDNMFNLREITREEYEFYKQKYSSIDSYYSVKSVKIRSKNGFVKCNK